MSEDYRRQHIVPQAYLKRFATKKGDRYVIGTRLKTDKGKKPVFFADNIRDVGYIDNYYDTIAHNDKKHWEHYLEKNIDGLYGSPLDSIISIISLTTPEHIALSQTSKNTISKIMVSQLIRIPEFIDYYMSRSVDFINSYKEKILSDNPLLDDNMQKIIKSFMFTADDRKNIILSSTFNEDRFKRYCHMLEERDWVVYYNVISSTMPFVTSDNPILVKNIVTKQNGLRANGFANDDIAFFFPITPSIMIALYSKHMLLGEMSKLNGKKEIISDIKFIGEINIELIEGCYRHSFLPAPLYNEANPKDKRLRDD